MSRANFLKSYAPSPCERQPPDARHMAPRVASAGGLGFTPLPSVHRRYCRRSLDDPVVRSRNSPAGVAEGEFSTGGSQRRATSWTEPSAATKITRRREKWSCSVTEHVKALTEFGCCAAPHSRDSPFATAVLPSCHVLGEFAYLIRPSRLHRTVPPQPTRRARNE